MTSADLVKECLALAKTDLLAAEHLFNTLRPVPLEIVAFHCQQCAEKYLKSVF